MIKSYKGFTLVEMLIVIVIIGILAAALIPKLTGAQAQARDTARYADLSQLGTAITIYSADNGSAPSGSGNANTLLSGMVGGYIKSIPSDPQTNNTAAQFCTGSTSSGGRYFYSSLTSTSNFVIVANTEVLKKGNRTGTTLCANVDTLSEVVAATTAGSGTMYIYSN